MVCFYLYKQEKNNLHICPTIDDQSPLISICFSFKILQHQPTKGLSQVKSDDELTTIFFFVLAGRIFESSANGEV